MASEGTLWDQDIMFVSWLKSARNSFFQEAHENAIRILVEEAKVNLCLRRGDVTVHRVALFISMSGWFVLQDDVRLQEMAAKSRRKASDYGGSYQGKALLLCSNCAERVGVTAHHSKGLRLNRNAAGAEVHSV